MTKSPEGNTPVVDLLSLLDAYGSAHDSGSLNLKASFFNLSKARRLKGGFHLGHGTGGATAFSAHDVREELRARTLLEVSGSVSVAPDFIEEGEDYERKVEENDKDCYTLHLDGMPTPQQNSSTSAEGTIEAGLRQRKNAPQSHNNQPQGKWTEEIPNRDKHWGDANGEDRRLRAADPIELFGGMSPPALKVAQAKAREALAAYVEAANLAAAILEITKGEVSK